MKGRWTIPILTLAALPALCGDPDVGRGVARVSLINGDITMQRGDSGDWIAAAVNAPLVAGDKIFAARASRAEVQLDWSNFIRIGENTEIRMADLENRRYQVQISRGVMTYRILRASENADVEIDTPAIAVRPLTRGVYRIEVMENGQTEITVREGEAEISSSQGTERLPEGRTMLARQGAPDSAVEVQVIRAAGRDDWDRWNERRDQQLERSQSYRYVDPSVYGVEDLDNYGTWNNVDSYGPSWFPRVAAGWSPYSYGRWVWVDWYGWTWVGYEPWGWAPYHYGRWFHHARFGWGWCPGPIVRTYWSPALVGFFGYGGHSGVSVGFGYGRIGWVPLAPGEPFYPWWGRGYYGRGNRVIVDNSVHITNITNVRTVYRNAGVNGGIVSVNTNDFARARGGSFQRANVAEVGNAGQIRGLLPVVPQRESLRVTDREARPSAIPRTDARETRFFSRREATPVDRVPFAEQRQQVERSVRSRATVEAAPVPRTDRRAAGVVAPQAQALTPQTAAPPANSRPIDRSNNGWRRFGDERRAGPDAASAQPRSTDRSVAPPPARERNIERDSGVQRMARPDSPERSRGYNEMFRGRSSEPQPRTEERRSTPRPLELNRPILTPRHEGGGHGEGHAARQSSGGERGDRGGKSGGDHGGKSERSGGSRSRQ